jgi:hypothetical protein
MGDEEGEPREKVVETPEPEQPSAPAFDTEELTAILQVQVANELARMMQSAIPAATAQAVAQLTARLTGKEGAETPEGSVGEEEQPDPMLFLEAIASSVPNAPNHHSAEGAHHVE